MHTTEYVLHALHHSSSTSSTHLASQRWWDSKWRQAGGDNLTQARLTAKKHEQHHKVSGS